MITAGELESYLLERIPLTEFMGLSVERLERGSIRLLAPLAPNRNHQQAAFGGSLASLATLAGWGLVRAELMRLGLRADIVIQKATLVYARPVTGELHAYCDLPPQAEWERFLGALRRRGRARVILTSWISGPDNAAVTMDGQFVAKLLEDK